MAREKPHQDSERVLAVVSEERAAVENADIARYLAILDDGAMFMPPDAPPKDGAVLRAWLKDFVDRFKVEWLSFVSTEVVVVADLAYHAYTYTWQVTPHAGGQSTVASGKGMHILRRQSDGSWKVAREIWNGSPLDQR